MLKFNKTDDDQQQTLNNNFFVQHRRQLTRNRHIIEIFVYFTYKCNVRINLKFQTLEKMSVGKTNNQEKKSIRKKT